MRGLFLCLAAPFCFADTAAVLPFTNSSPQAAMNWIGESVAETLREAFGSRGVVTLDRDDVKDAYARLRLKERISLTNASVLKIGEALDAEQVVFGRFEFTPSIGQAHESRGSLRVTAQILDRRRARQSPEFVETGALEDLATIEAHLAWRALTLLAPQQAPDEADFRALRQTIRLDAKENYIRGLLASAPEQQEKYYAQAARLDARFAHPRYRLGQLHYDRKEYRQAAAWLEKIGPSDIHYREASFLLGLARFQAGDYTGSEQAFQVIAATVPLAVVFNNLGAAESRRNLPQAVEDFKKAVESDPTDPDYRFNLGYALWKKGDFGPAADQFRAALDRDSEDQLATLMLGRCLKKQGLRPSDTRLQSLERLKFDYEERAYWQLKSMLDPK